MKLLMIFFFMNSLVFAQISSVPKDWINSQPEPSALTRSNTQWKMNNSLSSSKEMASLKRGYEQLLHYQSSMIEKLNGDEEKSWYLQSIKTELGVEAKGGLGLMGAGGEGALELIWIRKKNEMKNFSSFNDELQGEEAPSIQISSEMTSQEIQQEIRPIVDLAFKTTRIKKRSVLFKNLYKRALEFQKTVSELENTPTLGPWYPYKYQMELGISVEGKITPFLKIGNALRIRMEWWKIKKEQAPLMLNPPGEILSPNGKFVSAIAEDLSFIDQNYFQNGFQLNCMKVGVGTSVKGNLLIAKAQAHAKGSIFFLRHENHFLSQPFLASLLDSYNLESSQGVTKFRRHEFRQAIRKGANILSFFAANAPEKQNNRKFELNVIEAEFELFTNGGIGLVTVEGSAGLTLFATRNVII